MVEPANPESIATTDATLAERANVPDHAATDEDKELIKQKCLKFTKWCADVGIKYPKVDYPHFFEGGLVGGIVREPIKHREAFLYVPYEVLITTVRCLADPEMKPFYAEFPHLFAPEGHSDWEQLVLSTFLMRQRELGDKGFWGPYVEIMPDVTFFCDNKPTDIVATQDPYLVAECQTYHDELNKEWTEVQHALSKYPQLFPTTCNKATFMSFYAQVCTRCFGWGIPNTSMIPMADAFNHSDVSVLCEVVTKSLQMEANEKSTYFTRTKYMNDYRHIFSEEEVAKHGANITGRFNHENFVAN